MKTFANLILGVVTWIRRVDKTETSPNNQGKIHNGYAQMTQRADWYIDFLSPYPYLQLAKFDRLPTDLEVRPIPVLFPALLGHWENKGPAEIPA